jgi:hypothetical protein
MEWRLLSGVLIATSHRLCTYLALCLYVRCVLSMQTYDTAQSVL